MHDNTRTPPDQSRTLESSPPEYYAYHDPASPAKLSTTLVHALADVTGSDISEAGTAVANCIAPEALDRLFSRADRTHTTQGHVAFTTANYRVTVYSNGQIVITLPRHIPGYGTGQRGTRGR